MSDICTIATDEAPPPAGHYSQALVHGGLVFISGQLGFARGHHDVELAPVELQAARCLENLRAILHAAGSGMERVLKVTVYIEDIAMWPTVNAVYARYFGDHRPARSIVPVRTLHHGFSLEIEAVAALD